jgi:hypothetical protein
MSKAIKHPDCPEAKGIVRVKEYWSIMHIKAVKGMDDKGVEFGLTYFDNPGLSLPTWLTNWAAIAGIPEFLNKVRQAARDKRIEQEKKAQAIQPSGPQHGAVSKSNRVSNPEIHSDAKSRATFSKVPPRHPAAAREGTKPKEAKPNKSNEPADSAKSKGKPQSGGNKNASNESTPSPVPPPPPAAMGGAPAPMSTNPNVGSNNTSSSSEKGEILSQFFKDNFLTPPNPLNDG